MSESGYARAARAFRPERVRTLFVAESPLAPEERYFYFPRVQRGDSLWVELMKALYADFGETALERARKPEWLERFQRDGCFLIDAVTEPFPQSASSAERVRRIRETAPERARQIGFLEPEAVVLIKSTVWEGLHPALVAAGQNVLNRRAIPFPGSGQQRRFHKAMGEVSIRAIVGRSAPE